jgi:subtilase family serine protease
MSRCQLQIDRDGLTFGRTPQTIRRPEIAAIFAPTATEAKTVQVFFEANNLKVLRVGPNNFYVRAQGTVANVQKAFHVQLNEYKVGSKTMRANASDPSSRLVLSAVRPAIHDFHRSH